MNLTSSATFLLFLYKFVTFAWMIKKTKTPPFWKFSKELLSATSCLKFFVQKKLLFLREREACHSSGKTTLMNYKGCSWPYEFLYMMFTLLCVFARVLPCWKVQSFRKVLRIWNIAIRKKEYPSSSSFSFLLGRNKNEFYVFFFYRLWVAYVCMIKVWRVFFQNIGVPEAKRTFIISRSLCCFLFKCIRVAYWWKASHAAVLRYI